MYHYVRPIEGSEFPGIRGLEVEDFKRQLDYLDEKFNIISTEQVINAAKYSLELPDDACWLTFDDGYKDHYNYVMPELVKRNLHGAFFPPRVAVEEDVLLDVNLVHHILSCAGDVKKLASRLQFYCLENGVSESELADYYKVYAVANRFDDADTIFIKRMLQHILPEELRTYIAGELFKEYVGVSPANFSRQLYMSCDEVKGMINTGMYVGSHGSMHYWLNRITPDEQLKDIKQSLNFLEEVGAQTSDWVMCYPYGAYNDFTLSLLAELDASIGLTTAVRRADLKTDSRFELPRLDTNDFPR